MTDADRQRLIEEGSRAAGPVVPSEEPRATFSWLDRWRLRRRLSRGNDGNYLDNVLPPEALSCLVWTILGS